MHIAKDDIPVKLDAPGAIARHQPGFGDASAYAGLAGEYFSLGAGTDIAPLLQGLEGDTCHAPHWGYVLSGQVVVTYVDQPEETCSTGELFYWPPGHSVRVTDDVELILFSPTAEHGAVMDHMGEALAGMGA